MTATMLEATLWLAVAAISVTVCASRGMAQALASSPRRTFQVPGFKVADTVGSGLYGAGRQAGCGSRGWPWRASPTESAWGPSGSLAHGSRRSYFLPLT